MYIWIGCKLPEEFSREIRGRCLALAQGSALDFSGLSLPQHISLKISFDAGEAYPEILRFLEDLLRREAPFAVSPLGIQCHGNILWIPFSESPRLRSLHHLLDAELKNRFRIPQHPFDKEFRFHSTLCLGDLQVISAFAEQLAVQPLPAQLAVDTFLLGLSETGKSGTYRVAAEIKV